MSLLVKIEREPIERKQHDWAYVKANPGFYVSRLGDLIWSIRKDTLLFIQNGTFEAVNETCWSNGLFYKVDVDVDMKFKVKK